MARASRVRNDLSSSTISSERSPGIGAGTMTSVMDIMATELLRYMHSYASFTHSSRGSFCRGGFPGLFG